jgi:hypothetical protein
VLQIVELRATEGLRTEIHAHLGHAVHT